jgi:AmiR/NasT family two-component response regulator
MNISDRQRQLDSEHRTIKIFLVSQDPIFRLGLRIALETQPNLEIVGEAQSNIEMDAIAVREVQNTITQLQAENQLDLVILESEEYANNSQQLGLQCQQLKSLYPQLPILLLSNQNPQLISAARSIGVDGYCPKGKAISELVTAIYAVIEGVDMEEGEGEKEKEKGADGEVEGVRKGSIFLSSPTSPSPYSITGGGTPLLRTTPFSPISRLINNLRLSGNRYIQINLSQIKEQLQIPGLPILERAVYAGKQRELLAARWVLNHLLATPLPTPETEAITNLSQLPSNIPDANNVSDTINSPFVVSPRALQSDLFASCISGLQLPLENVADTPLEIDILRVDKKRELLYLILQKLAVILDELRSSQVEINQLYELHYIILRDLWQTTTTEFFGKFSRVRIGNSNIEIVNLLLQDAEAVQNQILNSIPLFIDLLSYLIFQSEFYIENKIYTANSAEAKAHALMILENLLIQIANSVIQPLLNRLADVETIKQTFYDRQYISTREIERFRNNLSWKYRLRNLVQEPQAIFESRYELFVFAPRGLAKISIYAPRNNELRQLTGVPFIVTLLLELRDAIAPRLQSLLSFFGSGVVFILTQVIGRSLGLIGRGILQGIGSVSFLEKNKKL